MVLVLLALLSRDELSAPELLSELGLGVALGVVVPAAALLLLRSGFTSATPLYVSLGGLSIGLMVLGLASATHANLFLAAFTAGITVATLGPEVEKTFAEFGELVTELLELAAILVFGALISPAFLAEIPVAGYVFALLALVLARPLAILVSPHARRCRAPRRGQGAAPSLGRPVRPLARHGARAQPVGPG